MDRPRLAATAAVLIAVIALSACGRSAPDQAGGDAGDTAGDVAGNDVAADGTDGEVVDGGESAMAGVRVVGDDPVVAVTEEPGQSTTTTATTFPVPTSQVYVIQSGDTMSGIAESFGVSIDDLRRANPTIEDISQIKQGQEIFIPTAG